MARSSFAVLVFVAAASSTALAQTATVVDPMAVLHGRRIPRQAPLPAGALELSPDVKALIQARISTLVGRAEQFQRSASAGNNAPGWLDHQLRTRSNTATELRRNGRLFAAQRAALEAVIVAQVVASWPETMARVEQTSAWSRMIDASIHDRIEVICRPLEASIPTTVATTIARLEAVGTCQEMRLFVEAIATRSEELARRLEPGQGGSDDRTKLLRLFIELLAPPLIEFLRDEVDHLTSLAVIDQIKGVRPMRLDEASMRRLAIAYEDSAVANLALLASENDSRSLPDADSTTLRRLYGFLGEQQLAWVRAHRKDPGPAAALVQLAVAFRVYQSMLATHALIDTVDVTIAARRFPTSGAKQHGLLALAEEARAAAATARVALGTVPAAVILSYQSGTSLLDGSPDERDAAVSDLVGASAVAHLAIALGSDLEDPAVARTRTPDETRGCIAQLASAEYGLLRQASGNLARRYGSIPAADRDDMILNTIVRVCLRARDLRRDMRPVFWRQLHNLAADWYRERDVYNRAAPKLTDCQDSPPSDPERNVIDAEDRDRIREALCQLPPSDQSAIRLYLIDNLTYAQVGQRLGISEEAARKRVQRALDQLRELYRQSDPLGQLRQQLDARAA